MYQLVTANTGSAAARDLGGIGTVHGRSFALYGETDEDIGDVIVHVECVVGPREGEVLVTQPFALQVRAEGLERRRFFFRRLNLELGTWTIMLQAGSGTSLRGQPRTIRVVDRE